ncbi:hypothetical protein ACNAN0_11890 [Agrilactobacillus fermenti]|uniref:hypothetical protein n=1 Tax=Agrilactobacillus fermenti TaxID=2586909 RepID=UPI003A5C1E13
MRKIKLALLCLILVGLTLGLTCGPAQLTQAALGDAAATPWSSAQSQSSSGQVVVDHARIKLLRPKSGIVQSGTTQGYQLQLKPGQQTRLVFTIAQAAVSSNTDDMPDETYVQLSTRSVTTTPNLAVSDQKDAYYQNNRKQPNFDMFFPKDAQNLEVTAEPQQVELPVRVPRNVKTGTFTGNLIFHFRDMHEMGVLTSNGRDQRIPVTIMINSGQPQKLKPLQFKRALTDTHNYNDGFLQATNVHGLRLIAMNPNPIAISKPKLHYRFYQRGKLVAQSIQTGDALAANETFSLVPLVPYLSPGSYRLRIDTQCLSGQLGTQQLTVKIPTGDKLGQSTASSMNVTQNWATILGSSLVGLGLISGGYLVIWRKKIGE